MNIGPGRPTEDGGPCSAGCSSTTTGAASSSPRAPNWRRPRISSRSRSSRSAIAPMPGPPRPGRRSSAGRPHKPAARPRSSRSRRDGRRARAGGSGPATGPCLRLASGSDGPAAPSGLRQSRRGFGDRRHERPAIRMIPSRTAWGFRKGSRRGERPIQDGRPGVSGPGESRSTSGACSPGRSGMPARPLTWLASERLRYRRRHHDPTTHQEHRP